jgi:CDP-glucose 4,6-dehydratase
VALRQGALENLGSMSSGFWRGRRVLLTGHTGFKGSWTALWLSRAGAEVSGFSLAPPSEPSLHDQARIADDVRSLGGDVRDLEAMRRAMRESQAEVVLHMAAQSLVRESYAAPVETYATNVMGTVNVLEAARLERLDGPRAIVVVTSDKCYENREQIWGYRETDAMGGHDPYSSSKGCAELVASAYRRSFFADPSAKVAVATVRAGNVIGGGDWARDRLVPDAMRAFGEGRQVVLRNPRSTRPWQHVLEPIGGYLHLAEKLLQGDDLASGWNFGPRDADCRPVGEVVDALAKLWGRGAGWVLEAGAQPHEAASLRLDCAKASAQLGWEPKLRLPTALEWVTEWYDGALRGVDARALCEKDLTRYQALPATRD